MTKVVLHLLLWKGKNGTSSLTWRTCETTSNDCLLSPSCIFRVAESHRFSIPWEHPFPSYGVLAGTGNIEVWFPCLQVGQSCDTFDVAAVTVHSLLSHSHIHPLHGLILHPRPHSHLAPSPSLCDFSLSCRSLVRSICAASPVLLSQALLLGSLPWAIHLVPMLSASTAISCPGFGTSQVQVCFLNLLHSGYMDLLLCLSDSFPYW